LVEGYLDLIVPFQFGVRNLVASLGTALTPEQVKLVGRFARKVVVNYDGDRAGVQAAKRAIETLLAEDIEVKVLVLPDNADPDEFIRKHGVNEYQQRRGEARPHIQFVIDEAVRDRNLHRPADKAAAVEETLPFVRAVRSRIQRREYFDIVMDALRVPADGRRELWQKTRGEAGADQSRQVGIQQIVARSARPTVAEERLLGLILDNEELRKIVLPRLEPEDYEGLATAAVFRALIELSKEEAEISFDRLNEATAGDAQANEVLARLMMTEPGESFDEARAQADSCLNALRLLKLDRYIDELTSEIAEAERAGQADKRDRLSMKLLELSKQRGGYLPPAQAS
jgi:DNA primase